MVQSMALKKDYGCLLGTGGQNQPLGIITAAGVAGSTIGSLAIGTDGGNATFEHIKKILAKIEEQSVSMEGVGLIMHSNVKNLLCLERISNYDTQVTGMGYVMPNNPIVNDQLLQNLIGYKIATSNQLPKNLTKGTSSDCSYIIGGNWREAMIGEWGGLSIAESSENRFTTDETVLRVITRMDFLLRHEEGFVICSDAKTTL
jgi:HK97 family phage major capsid protein